MRSIRKALSKALYNASLKVRPGSRFKEGDVVTFNGSLYMVDMVAGSDFYDYFYILCDVGTNYVMEFADEDSLSPAETANNLFKRTK